MTNHHPHAARIHRRIDALLIGITIVILVLIACTSARAADTSWLGGSTNWQSSSNWSNGKPGSGDNALFDNLFTGTSQPSLNNETIGGIWMKSAVTKSVTITGSGLTINGNTINGGVNRGILLDNSNFTLTVSASVILGGSQAWQNDSTTPATGLTVSGTVNLGGNTLTVGGAGKTLMSGAVSGTGGAITKSDSGTLALSGNNTYTGTTTINGGTLNANGGANQALGGTSGVVVNGGGTLLLSSSNQINNSATMTLNGGTLRLAGVSEGTATNGGAGVGALTLSAAGGVTSTIDFSGASGIIHFSGIAQTNNGSFLDITNWNGSLGGGGAERLLFSGTASSFTSIFTQSEVLFGGVAGYTAIQFTGFYEITPVPEPSTWIGGALAVSVLGWTQRRRFARLINRAA